MYKQNLCKGPMQGSITKFGGSLNFSLHYSPCMANSLVPLHGYNKTIEHKPRKHCICIRIRFYLHKDVLKSCSSMRATVADDPYLRRVYYASCAHEQKAHGLQQMESIYVANKNTAFAICLWPCQTIQNIMKPLCSTILTDLLCLRVAQMPRSPHLLISVLTDKQTDRTDHLNLLLVHVQVQQYNITLQWTVKQMITFTIILLL